VRGPLADADEKALLEDIDTKVVGYMRYRALDEDARRSARPSRHHGQPGASRSDAHGADEETERRAKGDAIGRIVDAREIGLVVAFLASAKAAAVTGVAIDASGGSIPVMFQ